MFWRGRGYGLPLQYCFSGFVASVTVVKCAGSEATEFFGGAGERINSKLCSK